VSIHAEDEASNGTKRPGGDGESAGDVANRFMDVIKVRTTFSLDFKSKN